MENKFIVNCERIPRRQAYYLSFPINDYLIDKIRNLPEGTRKWNSQIKSWELTTVSLLALIKQFKGSDKIFFSFGSEANRLVFKNQITKIEEGERKKKEQFETLIRNKEEWNKYKLEIEENYEQYSDMVHKNLKEGVKLLPYQICSVLFMNKVRNGLLALDMGLGKAQQIDSKILTPNGWVRIGDIKVNDFVIGSDGKPKRVLGVFPQGVRKSYNVSFNDGTSVECSDEHIWAVNTTTRINRTLTGVGNYPYQLKTVNELINEGLYLKNGNRKHYIPIVKPIEFEEKTQFIDPYVLGCLLGNGGLTRPFATGFTTADLETIDAINLRLPSNHILKPKNNTKYEYNLVSINQIQNDVTREIKRLGLSGHSSYHKFIPNNYKFGSIEQRLEILQGILDTDGHAGKDCIEITLASKQLIEDTQFIVESLGGIARLHDKWVMYEGERRLYYRLYVKLPAQFTPFKLQRKIDNFKAPTKYPPNRGIDKIEYVGDKECQCILIDSEDHLYCTEHCILTHNTICSIAYSELNEFKKVFVITPNSLKYNFMDEASKFSNSKSYIIGKKNDNTIEESKYIIVNYEYFNPADHKKFLNKWNKLNIGKIDCLIMDESHRIKSSVSNSYKNISKTFSENIFRDGNVSKIFMSGTPAENAPNEIYTVMNQISPLEFHSQTHFKTYYCGMIYDPNQYGWVSGGQAKLDELFQKISPYMYRKKKLDVLKDLPPKRYQKIYLEMTDAEQLTYDKLEEGVANEFIDKDIKNPLAILGRLRQYTSHLKVNNICELIDSILETGEKLVVEDFFKESLYELHEKYPNNSALHIGGVKDDDRNEIKKDFQDENGKIKILLGSEGTIKEGLTLTAASKMAILTIPWNFKRLSQISDRCCRLGQKFAVNIFIFCYKNSIDEYVYDMIMKKENEVSQAIDGEKFESDAEESVVNEIMNKIKQKHKK